jgi:hypothetical protein
MTQTQAAPPTTPYGAPISFEAAKRAMEAAEREAMKNNLGIAIAIVDSGGNLVMVHRLDNAQLSSARLAEAKARTSVEFRRPTKVFEDAVAGGGLGLRVLTFGACWQKEEFPSLSKANSSAQSACRARPLSRTREWRRRGPTQSRDRRGGAALCEA